MKHVIKRVVCRNADIIEVIEWCRRILGGEGWGTSIQINDGRPYQADPVILLYNTLERPIEQIELMIALRWS